MSLDRRAILSPAARVDCCGTLSTLPKVLALYFGSLLRAPVYQAAPLLAVSSMIICSTLPRSCALVISTGRTATAGSAVLANRIACRHPSHLRAFNMARQASPERWRGGRCGNSQGFQCLLQRSARAAKRGVFVWALGIPATLVSAEQVRQRNRNARVKVVSEQLRRDG